MLTKRQQYLLVNMRKNFMWPSWAYPGLLGTVNDYFAYMSAYVVMDAGLAAFDGRNIYLTPAGERLAGILGELPAPLTRRQWQILLRFRDVGTMGPSAHECLHSSVHPSLWLLPVPVGEPLLQYTTERTIRILCDSGLIGFDRRRRVHLTPLGQELVSLLP